MKSRAAAPRCSIQVLESATRRCGGASVSGRNRALRYHPLFDCDVREVANLYDRHAAGLGNLFVDSFRQAVDEIVSDPDRFAEELPGCRYSRVLRFPYVVLFDVIDSELLFFGVLHTARSRKR